MMQKRFSAGAKAALICLGLALAACGQQGSEKQPAPTEPDQVLLGSTQNMPDWLFVARQRDCVPEPGDEDNCIGEIHFNQRSIIRRADGTADIWIQVRHARPQLFSYETETTATAVNFTVERLLYRFNCTEEKFFVVDRQILGPNEVVVARDAPRQIWRAPVQGSVTSVIMPVACHGR